MLGLRITRHAIMAHAGKAPLARALASAPTIRDPYQHYRAIHDKAHEAEGTENAATTSKSVDGPVQRSTDRLEPTKEIPNAAEKTVTPSGEEFLA